MGVSLINKVKYSKTIYSLYSWAGSIVVNVVKWFVKKDNHLIVFVSFGGRRFDDSPRAIYEQMLQDERFNAYRLVWAFINPESYSLKRGEKIKIDTLKYYKILLQAKVWITNSSVERGLHFKGRNCLYFNTWHGSAIKVMGNDIADDNASFGNKTKKKGAVCNYDVFLAQGQHDIAVFSKAFCIPKNTIKLIGLPRNDVLIQGGNEDLRNEIRRIIHIPYGKKVILYAPTFREYEKDTQNNCKLTLPLDLVKWEKELGDEYVFLLRAHYEVVKGLNVNDNGFVFNVSDYPNLNDLMIVSDMLISDYSSIFFDYSIQGKPMLTYCYDYDRYASERGMYFDIRRELDDYATNEEELLNNIKTMDIVSRSTISLKFRDKYVTEFGKATIMSLDAIQSYLQKNN